MIKTALSKLGMGRNSLPWQGESMTKCKTNPNTDGGRHRVSSGDGGGAQVSAPSTPVNTTEEDWANTIRQEKEKHTVQRKKEMAITHWRHDCLCREIHGNDK